MAQPQMPRTRHWRFEIDHESLGWLTIDTPKAAVNTLSREALSELETLVSRFEDLIATGELLGVILLSGKESGFIAGADVSEFDAMADYAILPEALRRTHAKATRRRVRANPFAVDVRLRRARPLVGGARRRRCDRRRWLLQCGRWRSRASGERHGRREEQVEASHRPRVAHLAARSLSAPCARTGAAKTTNGSRSGSTSTACRR